MSHALDKERGWEESRVERLAMLIGGRAQSGRRGRKMDLGAGRGKFTHWWWQEKSEKEGHCWERRGAALWAHPGWHPSHLDPELQFLFFFLTDAVKPAIYKVSEEPAPLAEAPSSRASLTNSTVSSYLWKISHPMLTKHWFEPSFQTVVIPNPGLVSLSLQVQCVATLQVGSMQASDPSECGQCLSLAWMPTRPHHHLAAGYYNGKKTKQNIGNYCSLNFYICLFFGCFPFGSVFNIM